MRGEQTTDRAPVIRHSDVWDQAVSDSADVCAAAARAAIDRAYGADLDGQTILRAMASALRSVEDAIRSLSKTKASGATSYHDALHRIAFEPFGHSESTHEEVLEAITSYARRVLDPKASPAGKEGGE